MQRWLNQFHRSRFHLPKIPSRKENRPLAIIRRWGTMKEWHEDKRDRPATEGETLHTALKKAVSVLEKKSPHAVKQDLI